MIEIRKEQPVDQTGIHRLNLDAFDNGPEAVLVDRLRACSDNYISFVAVDQDAVVGHIVFTPVTIDNSALIGIGLAPMAVLPSHQRKGIGSQLVRYGIEHLRDAGWPFIVVLGHPQYYPRFGFEPASHYKLLSQWEGVPDEAFMILVFDKAAMPKAGGIARYRDEFDAAM